MEQPQSAIEWLKEQVIDVLGKEEGSELIAQAARTGSARYAVMLAYLREWGYKDVAEEYAQRRREDAARARLKTRLREIQQLEARIAEGAPNADYLRKRLIKAKKYLAGRGALLE